MRKVAQLFGVCVGFIFLVIILAYGMQPKSEQDRVAGARYIAYDIPDIPPIPPLPPLPPLPPIPEIDIPDIPDIPPIPDMPEMPFYQTPLTLTLVRPQGGESASGVFEIQWVSTGDDVTIHLSYSVNGEAWKTVAAGLANSGAYLWDTTQIPDAGDVVILVQAQDRWEESVAETSGAFLIDNIAPSSFHLSYETLQGKTLTFSWQSAQDAVSQVLYRVMLDDQVIAENLTQTFFNTVIPQDWYGRFHSWSVVAVDSMNHTQVSEETRRFELAQESIQEVTVEENKVHDVPLNVGETIVEEKEYPQGQAPIPISQAPREFLDSQRVVGTIVKKVEENGEIATTGGLAFGLYSFLTSIPSFAVTPLLKGFTTSDLASLPQRLFTLLLALLLRQKKRMKPWGVVYDSITKLPVDPAVVTLKNEKGKDLSTRITDIDGRFGFLVDPGNYTVEVKKANYLFPSKVVLADHDEVYDKIYHGEAVPVAKSGQVITVNIPIDPIGFDWNQAKKFSFYSAIWQRVMFRVSSLLFYVGFVLSFIWMTARSSGLNIAIFGLYILFFGLRLFVLKPKTYGVVFDHERNPISYALVKVFSTEQKVMVAASATDEKGRYYLLFPYPGSFFYTVSVKNQDGSYTEVFHSDVAGISAKDKAILNKDVFLV
ncbi:MAG TPA: carboxypeptidase-like regulatory domain-containing protein [Patescibacteria group bacterium]|nr:carboxypeptidase-like regulatory domain-containing protein [Patescibacteria group bacterium]